MTLSLIGVCSFFLALISAILVVHKKYEDGLFGRIFLAGIFFCCLIIVLVEVTGTGTYKDASLELRAISVFLAGFFARHLYRFFRWSSSGEGDWTKKGQPRRTAKNQEEFVEERRTAERRKANDWRASVSR